MLRQDPQYIRSITVPLCRPSADTALIVGAAIDGLRAIYRPDYEKAKAGVMLELQPDSVQQHELALEDDCVVGRGHLMAVFACAMPVRLWPNGQKGFAV